MALPPGFTTMAEIDQLIDNINRHVPIPLTVNNLRALTFIYEAHPDLQVKIRAMMAAAGHGGGRKSKYMKKTRSKRSRRQRRN
jgi:hypothetical protein